MLTQEQSDHLRVVLVAARNPLNIGAAARAMSNFGFARLRVVNPYQIAFREARSAVGAAGLLEQAEEFAGVAEAVGDCSLVIGTSAVGTRQIQQPVHNLEQAGAIVRSHLQCAPAAILFGSEKRGLSNDDLSHCHWLLRISTRAEHPSMNLGQAVAVCLYELARPADAHDKPLPGEQVVGDTSPKATAAELDRLTEALLDSLARSGYTKPGAELVAEEKARRLIRRLHLEGNDSDTLTGMLARIAGSLRRNS
jgi:TrmH family RNA methyltransferase